MWVSSIERCYEWAPFFNDDGSMKRRLGASWFPRVRWEGFGELKMKHEKGFGCFIVPNNGVGRVSEGLKRTMKKGLGASWFPRVGWEWFGKAKYRA